MKIIRYQSKICDCLPSKNEVIYRHAWSDVLARFDVGDSCSRDFLELVKMIGNGSLRAIRGYRYNLAFPIKIDKSIS